MLSQCQRLLPKIIHLWCFTIFVASPYISGIFLAMLTHIKGISCYCLVIYYNKKIKVIYALLTNVHAVQHCVRYECYLICMLYTVLTSYGQ